MLPNRTRTKPDIATPSKTSSGRASAYRRQHRQAWNVESSASTDVSDSDLQRRLDEASREVDRLRDENERLQTLLGLSQRIPSIVTAAEVNGRVSAPTPDALVHSSSSAAEKVALIRGLFRGRDDVYALRWENARTGQSGYVPAVLGGWGRSL